MNVQITKSKRMICLMIAVMMLSTLFIGCGTQPATTGSSAAATTSAEASASAAESAAAEPTAAALEPYTFTHYFNYDWWDITKKWGADEVSKYYQKKFNITIDFQKPDSDPAAKLNLMISSGDLPDSFMMDRGVDNQKMARLGLFVPLEPFMADNKDLEDNVLPISIKQLQIDGKLYGIPNWPLKVASGGNNAWLYDTRLYASAGSPKLETMDDLYNYAMKIKTDVPKNKEGMDTIPVIFDATADGNIIASAFFRSFGGVLVGWNSAIDGTFGLAFRDPLFKEATMEANKWWRGGLFSPTQFSDTVDQILEKIVSGRTALLYYDHSKDETNKYRKQLIKNFPDDAIEMVAPFPYPPAKGLPTSKIYAEYHESLGWNVTCITTKATQPKRIFDMWTSFYTDMGSIIMMYGPKGGNWDTLDENGLPILKKAESELSIDEINQLGDWFWAIPGQGDNVNRIKFAINEKLPKEKQNWVISHQANILLPLQWITDEFAGITDAVDPMSDTGIARMLCEDYIKAQYPKVLMAATADESAKLFQDIVDFCDKNGYAAVEKAYDTAYKAKVALVGTGLTK